MKAPVWMLINHVDLVGGNSSYHRAMLVDQFVRHFWDWCFIGVASTKEWGWDMWDQANQFVAEGFSGGLATFVCFVLAVSWSFGRMATARRASAGDRSKQWLCWLLGSALFTHVVAFFGISFSDQSAFAWYALLAMMGAAAIRGETAIQDPVSARRQAQDERAAAVTGSAPAYSNDSGWYSPLPTPSRPPLRTWQDR